MRLRTFGGLLALAALGLSGCGGGGGAADPATPAQAAADSSGPGVTDAKACDVPYGDPPAALSPLDSVSGDAERILSLLFNQCWEEGGETLHWTDAQSEARGACLFTPANASTTAQLPLVVYLQGSLFPAAPQVIYNDWVSLYKTADLNGDASRPGFILLVPIGRNTHHFYPFPDTYNLGWDNWYRNLDRSSPDLNLDVAAIDQFIGQVEGRGIVDSNRVYVTGWSNGAAMAQLYALNTPSIAASAVYSSPDPFSDVQDPCEQTPFATTLTPLMDIHNSCDVIGICQTGTQFHKDLAGLFPSLVQDSVIVDSNKVQVQACNAACASQTIAGDPAGLINHMNWPSSWDSAMFAWLREHPLEAKQ
jgi:poly(3-hydroxybutyrate) depolymerase